MKTFLGKLFGRSIFSRINLRFVGYTRFPMTDYFKIVDLINQNGSGVYAFSSTDKKNLTSILIRKIVGGGIYSHSGLILFNGVRETKILHMKGDGLHLDYLLDLLKEIDYMTVVKLPVSDIQKANRRIQDIIDKQDIIKYDYDTNLANGNKYYCSELIHVVCNGLVDDPDFKEKLIAGRKIFDPDTVIKCGDVIYGAIIDR